MKVNSDSLYNTIIERNTMKISASLAETLIDMHWL